MGRKNLGFPTFIEGLSETKLNGYDKIGFSHLHKIIDSKKCD